MPTPRPVLHWFRQDLRLSDNRALTAALGSGQPVIPVFILDDDTAGRWAAGGASRWWLHHSLHALAQALGERGAALVLRRGGAIDVLQQLIDETAATGVFWTRCYEPHAAALERELAGVLASRGVECRRFGGALLHEPEAVRTADDKPFQVFTPFWRACLRLPEASAPLPAPERMPAVDTLPPSASLEDLELLPRVDWASGLRSSWQPGEAVARARLIEFVDGPMRRYGDLRNRPDLAATSRLSPYLHHGEISPRQCWHAAMPAIESGAAASGGRSFLRELLWREFSYHLLHHFPSLPEQPFREEFGAFPWRDEPTALVRWQEARTGYPLVDAAMRELWHTGWMHNRARMVVASFLVKHLLIPWQAGEAWFWDTLVDADLASNSASWQWVAGCGADAAPYFRVFNPLLQSRKFDPKGAYLRRWLPELASLSDSAIHAPWEASELDLGDAGVRLGTTYPRPMVEHGDARNRALAAFKQIKKVS